MYFAGVGKMQRSFAQLRVTIGTANDNWYRNPSQKATRTYSYRSATMGSTFIALLAGT